MTETSIGLEGVCVAETELSLVDGTAGNLVIRGERVEDLVSECDFESTISLMWTGVASDDFAQRLGNARASAFSRLDELKHLLDYSDPMDAVRAFVGGLQATGDLTEDAIRATAAIPVFAAVWSRHQDDAELLCPNPQSSHAHDYLRMLNGKDEDTQSVRALDTYLMTVVDHGLNASTFAARVVASTRSDLISAITAAVGALKGPLHGGAPGPVSDMLDAIGTAERAEQWIQRELDAGRRIMGMGHRVYRVRDPRAEVLERALASLPVSLESSARHELAHTVEQAAARELACRKPDRKICANVEFYTAILLERLGIPRNLFSATFAVGRVVGWCAHVMEEQARGRLIRPKARYVGPYRNSRKPRRNRPESRRP